MNDEIEDTTITEANSGKVTYVPCRESIETEGLGQRHDRGVNEAQAEIREASVHVHRTRGGRASAAHR